MLALIACFAAVQVQIDQPPRLRTVFSNGASVLVEKAPASKSLILELLISSRGTEESPVTNGLRHLLEHLSARGPKGELDAQVETAGGFLSADTFRDAMRFKLSLPPGQLSFGLKVMEKLMQMPQVTPESIKLEADIIAQEAALAEDPAHLSAAAWTHAFGDQCADVIGNDDVMRNATPEMLSKLHHSEFVGPNLALVVVGDVDLDATTTACNALLSHAPGTVPVAKPRLKPQFGRTSARADSQVVAVAASGWRSPDTAAKVAAVFALSTVVEDSFVVYTPSSGYGLIQLGMPKDAPSLASVVGKENKSELFLLGREVARQWVRSTLRTPSEVADSRGLLLVQQVDLKPETLLENLDTMSFQRFKEALEEFLSEKTITVVGK